MKTKIIELDVEGPAEIQLETFLTDSDIEIVTRLLSLLPIGEGSSKAIMTVNSGRAYVPAGMKTKDNAPVGTLARFHCSVTKVNHQAEPARCR